MQDLETKTQLLASISSKLESGACTIGQSKTYGETLASQSLLCADTAANGDTMVKWTQTVSQWFQRQLGELSSDQVNTIKISF